MDARDAAEKAIALDPSLKAAHVEMARIAMTFDWDYPAAVAHLRAAKGNNVQVLRAASLALQFGKYDLAVNLARQAVRLDPVSSRAHGTLALSLIANRQFAEAEQALNEAIMLSPDSIHANAQMAILRLEQGMPEEALRIAEGVPVEEIQIYMRSMAKFALGDIQGSDEQLALYIQMFGDESGSGTAAIYAFRGEPDLAFLWLERAFESRDNAVSSIKTNPLFRKLDNHPKMQPLLSKIGLSDEQIAAIDLDSALSLESRSSE